MRGILGDKRFPHLGDLAVDPLRALLARRAAKVPRVVARQVLQVAAHLRDRDLLDERLDEALVHQLREI